jgi:hypothetical protein
MLTDSTSHRSLKFLPKHTHIHTNPSSSSSHRCSFSALHCLRLCYVQLPTKLPTVLYSVSGADFRFYCGVGRIAYVRLHVMYVTVLPEHWGIRCYPRLPKPKRSSYGIFCKPPFAVLISTCSAIDISQLVQAGAVPRLNESYCSWRQQRESHIPVFPQPTAGQKPADSPSRHAPFQSSGPSYPLHSVHDTSS